MPSPNLFSKEGLDLAEKLFDFKKQTLSQNEFDQIAPNYDVLLIRFNLKITKKNYEIKFKDKSNSLSNNWSKSY